MRRFLFGCFLSYFLVTLVMINAPRTSLWWQRSIDSTPSLILSVIALPLLTIWVAAEFQHLIRPRRLFLGRQRATLFLIFCGGFTSIAALGLGAIGLAYLDQRYPDGLILALAAFLTALITLSSLSRHRKGQCLYCRYDLRGMTTKSSARCPECGTPNPHR